MTDVPSPLAIPPLTSGPSFPGSRGPSIQGPGKRMAVIAPEYQATDVHHMLYLPPDWDPNWRETGQSWPVIVEYTGNRYPLSGSTGEVEDAALGFGLSGGRFIWVVLPFVASDGRHNEITWWGDEEATVAYAKQAVPRICSQYGGDPESVFLCGFSRGAIAVNYIGLFDDEIAALWRGFITHDHYDGVQEWPDTTWGTPLDAYRSAATGRLARLGGRPVLVCQNGSTWTTQKMLRDDISLGDFTFLDVPIDDIIPDIPNETVAHAHTDRWLLWASPTRRRVQQWFDRILANSSDEDSS